MTVKVGICVVLKALEDLLHLYCRVLKMFSSVNKENIFNALQYRIGVATFSLLTRNSYYKCDSYEILP
jgi:hypothetical protein